MNTWNREIHEEKKDLWEVSYRDEDWDEDNDTSDEDEDEETFDKDFPLKPVTNSTSDKYSSDLLNPKKGFKFFIE